MVAASDREAVCFILTGGQCNDSPAGLKLIEHIRKMPENVYLIMDRAYSGRNIRKAAHKKGLVAVVPPKRNMTEHWEYDKERYKERNVVERLFLRLKRFRRIATRYDKLDVVFSNFIYLALIIDAIIV